MKRIVKGVNSYKKSKLSDKEVNRRICQELLKKFRFSGMVGLIADKNNSLAMELYKSINNSFLVKDDYDYDILVDFGDIDNPNTIDKINNSGAYVISLGLNSGLGVRNGLCRDAVRSNVTFAINDYVPGHFLNEAKDYIKELRILNIGLEFKDYADLFEFKDAKGMLKLRNNFTSKRDFGSVSMIGGSIKYSGAIKLANLSKSSLYSGVGLSRLCVPKSISNAVLPYILESTLLPMADKNGIITFDRKSLDDAMKDTNAMLIGPGLDIFDKKIMEYILKNYNMPLVVDADGINVLAKVNPKFIKEARCKIIVTPHNKEFARLSKHTLVEILNNPIKVARDYASKYGVIVLLKGPTTIVTDGKETYLVTVGTPGMATAGSGDVLSGILVGLLGFNVVSPKIVATGAYINGYAGMLARDKYGEISMTSSKTIEFIPNAIKNIMTKENIK